MSSSSRSALLVQLPFAALATSVHKPRSSLKHFIRSCSASYVEHSSRGDQPRDGSTSSHDRQNGLHVQNVQRHSVHGRQQPGENWITLAFKTSEVNLSCFLSESFSFALPPFQSKGTGRVVRDAEKSLGKFALEMLDFRLQLKSDDAKEVYLILNQCVLDDSRPGQEQGITRCVSNTQALHIKNRA